MTDKDEFKFDAEDTFPETDLSDAFAEGERSAPEEPEQPTEPEEPEYPMTIKPAGGSRTRLLLVLLLLVVVGGGAYYFLLMEEPPPPPAKRAVASAPKPASPVQPAPPPVAAQGGAPATPPTAAAPPAPAPAEKASVTVAPPPKPPAPQAPPAAVKPAEPPAAAAVKPAPTPVATAPVKAEPKPEPPPAPAPVKPAPPTVAKPAPAAASGPWLVEAGTYMNAAALKAAEGKIRALGYETQVANFKKTVRMTRLRIGSVPESELKEALARVRALSPEAFALPGKGGFTLYAGTFTSQQNLRQLSARLAGEGIKAEEEPVEMERTISLLRFGGFADQAAASEAAARARRSGIAAEVIQPR